ncbi:hypothetical protein Q8W71_17850 [Methylobacterium sp. NEAU 140]|uniref:hypothetical protein n=1 Tax=Methylobacterium sp. NEAU 140 TaxID=3064945 RepID=UPI0027374F8A|nr:hypothetical protein [Methylobacterium sp. NEAU 140]MDP4024491.1 hypothetical protein [Methylobacterium sp. NEAU 140]
MRGEALRILEGIRSRLRLLRGLGLLPTSLLLAELRLHRPDHAAKFGILPVPLSEGLFPLLGPLPGLLKVAQHPRLTRILLRRLLAFRLRLVTLRRALVGQLPEVRRGPLLLRGDRLLRGGLALGLGKPALVVARGFGGRRVDLGFRVSVPVHVSAYAWARGCAPLRPSERRCSVGSDGGPGPAR